MHPAYSVIAFTTASGAGYGLLALFGLFAACGLLPASTWLGLVGLGLAFALIGGGLAASTFHLGHPERALGAFTQWRSSWLAREGVAAVLSFVPAGLFAIGWVFANDTGGVFAGLGVVSAVMAGLVVWCTSMIYASLKPIRQWHNVFVTPLYLVLGLMTGALLLVVLSRAFGVYRPAFAIVALIALGVGWILKAAYWRFIDRSPAKSGIGTATGLGSRGRVRLLEQPHTEANYLMLEMGYQIARKHAQKLRRLVHFTLFAAPLTLMVVATLAGPALSGLAAALAVASGGLGIVVERWLFFAEARHACMLYYGRAA